MRYSYQIFMKLEDHLAEQINTPIYQVLKNNLVTFIRNILGKRIIQNSKGKSLYIYVNIGLQQFDATIILRTASILDTNTFEIRPFNKGSKVRAIFPEAAMLSHDCVPNTRHVFDENMQIQIISTGKFKKNSLLNYNINKISSQ